MKENNCLGLDQNLISEALQKGIEIFNNGKWEHNIGNLSLVWHPYLKRFVFVFGNTAENAGFVLLEDKDKLWRLCPHG